MFPPPETPQNTRIAGRKRNNPPLLSNDNNIQTRSEMKTDLFHGPKSRPPPTPPLLQSHRESNGSRDVADDITSRAVKMPARNPTSDPRYIDREIEKPESSNRKTRAREEGCLRRRSPRSRARRTSEPKSHACEGLSK